MSENDFFYSVEDNTQYDSDGYFTLPVGEYRVAATNARVGETRTGGRIVIYTYTVLVGQFKNGTINYCFNIENANELAVQISRKKFNSFMRACGKSLIRNADELLNIPITIKVKSRIDKRTGSEIVEISDFIGVSPSFPTKPATATLQIPRPDSAEESSQNYSD